jgi:hypothetical protein
LNVLSLGRTSNPISFFAVKNTMIIIFAPTVCRVLGMTSAAEWANICGDAVVCENQDSSPVAMLSKSFVADSCKILHIYFAASTRATSWASLRE